MEYEKLVIEITAQKTKRYKLNGKRHRLDGPAVEWINGNKQWQINGDLHREDGSAIERSLPVDYHWLNHLPVLPQEQEQVLHIETLKLGSITQFIDFVARRDILLL